MRHRSRRYAFALRPAAASAPLQSFALRQTLQCHTRACCLAVANRRGVLLRSCPPPKVPGGPWAPPLLRSAAHPSGPLLRLFWCASTKYRASGLRLRAQTATAGGGPGRRGALRSEVKEEPAAARPPAGDMSGAARPGGLGLLQGQHAQSTEVFGEGRTTAMGRKQSKVWRLHECFDTSHAQRRR